MDVDVDVDASGAYACDDEFEVLFTAVVELHEVNSRLYQCIGRITALQANADSRKNAALLTEARAHAERLAPRCEEAARVLTNARYSYELAIRRVCR